MRILGIVIILCLICAVGCRTSQQYTSRPAKGTASADSELLEVEVVLFHNTDSTSRVFVEVKNENLLYKRPDTTSVFYSHLRIVTHLMFHGNPRKIIDSSSVQLFDRAGKDHVALKSIYSDFEVTAPFGDNYLLVVEVFDINRRTRYSKNLNVYKTSKLGAQNFLVKHNDSVAFKNNFLQGQRVSVRYADPSQKVLTVECFQKEFGPALPPFSTREPDPRKYKPDSSFSIPSRHGTFDITMPARGFYHLKVVETQNSGLTLHTYDESFPGVSSADEMINCARYIMSQEEFDRCKTSPDPKKAIDDFWLNIGGSNERARELLRRYYGRVKEANKYYSSFTQGWKSDRGMIYIIFGKPVNIYKSRKDEIWVYGNEANPATLRFVFNKTENPFSDNDYMMERSQFYKEPWHSAVDYWRQGHVYTNRMR